MRATLLDAADPGQEACRQGADALRRALGDYGLEVTEFHPAELPVAPCRGCFACWTTTPGLCPHTDASERIARQAIASDLLVLYAPLAFGGWPWRLKQVLDRLIGLLSPLFDATALTRHRPRYPRYPALLGVGWLAASDPEEEALFARLVEKNAYNLHAPAGAALTLDGGKQWSVQRKACLNALGGVLP